MTDRNIHQRILAVMQDTGAFGKDGKNTFHNYKYASVESIVAHIQPNLVKHGVALLYSVSECVQMPVRQFTQGKGWVENEVTRATVQVSAVNVDDPKDFVCCQTFGFGLDSQDKGIYKAISGARKYGIFGMFNLMAGDDDPEYAPQDAPKAPTTRRPAPAPKSSPQPPTTPNTGAPMIPKEKRGHLMGLFKDCNLRERDQYIGFTNEVLNRAGQGSVTSTKDLTLRQADLIIDALEEKLMPTDPAAEAEMGASQ